MKLKLIKLRVQSIKGTLALREANSVYGKQLAGRPAEVNERKSIRNARTGTLIKPKCQQWVKDKCLGQSRGSVWDGKLTFTRGYNFLSMVKSFFELFR